MHVNKVSEACVVYLQAVAVTNGRKFILDVIGYLHV